MAHPNLGLLAVHLKSILRARRHDSGRNLTSWDCERITYVDILRALMARHNV